MSHIAASYRVKSVLAKARSHNFINIEDENQIQHGAAFRFKQYTKQFRDMAKRSFIDTEYDIISVTISYDSKYALSIVFRSDKQNIIRIYSLKSADMSTDFISEHIIRGFYIKAKQISQTDDGSLFCCPYFDDGIFKIILFDVQKTIKHINISEILGIDKRSRPNIGFPDPLINAVFINNDQLFINLFHNKDLTHWHLIYDIQKNHQITDPVCIQMSNQVGNLMYTTKLNFPYKNFYDQKRKKVYCFYRQGQSFTVDVNHDHKNKNMCCYEFQKIISQDFGQMYLIYDEILIARTQDKVVFFKQVEIQNYEEEQWEHKNEHKIYKWKQYHSLDHRGFIFFVKGNNRIQITLDRLIYFYYIDTKTLMPSLENCMYNFMGCSHMMFGPRSMYCITYKSGQVGFSIYSRKYNHAYLAQLSATCYQDSIALSINSNAGGYYMITEQQNIKIYDEETHSSSDYITVPFIQQIMFHDVEYPLELEILNMQVAKNPRILAVLVGHNYIHNSSISLFLFIYMKVKDDWQLKLQRDLPEELQKTSKFFHFNKDNINEILLADEQKIIRYNYDCDSYEGFYVFENALNSQPIFVVFNQDQTTAIISTFYDVLFMRFKDDHELDIDNEYKVGDIRSVVYVNEVHKFYMLANKCHGLLGYYLMEIDEYDPCKQEPKLLINWKSKLDIGDASMFTIDKGGLRYLVLSYKSIYINTYNVLVVDLETKLIQFRHEKYHLWEAKIAGVLLKNYEYVMISQDGRQVMSLGFVDKRPVADQDKNLWMIHSLDSCNDLILEESNHLLFRRKGSQIVISIQEQHTDHEGDTYFEDVYKVMIQDMSLRELLFCQSLFSCRQQEDVFKLITYQPNTSIFYRSLLELEKSNLTSILSFDSRSIKVLLDEKNNSLFQNQFPIFYKTKYNSSLEGQRQSAIDTALDNNQIRALNLIIDYVVKFQNSYVYSYLFTDNMLELIQRGVDVSKLLESDIFYHRFDFQEWPAIHTDAQTQISPFNGSMFRLRENYKLIFDKIIDDVDFNQTDIFGIIEPKKIFKIKYTLNILPSMKEDPDAGLMSICGDVDVYSDQENIFSCKALQDLLDFKWEEYGSKVHYVGFAFHAVYFTIFSIYVCQVFIYRDLSKSMLLLLLMTVSLFYPLAYDMTQLKKQGLRIYMKDIWNYFDQAHIWIGFFNIINQFNQTMDVQRGKNEAGEVVSVQGVENVDPNDFLDDHPSESHSSKLILIIVVFLMLVKTFFFLRIFTNMSYLVTMMRQVMFDLRIFGVFYLILLWLCSLIMNILEVGQYENQASAELRAVAQSKSYPGIEYRNMPGWSRQFLSVLRISLGDFDDFGEVVYLEPMESSIYWFVWILIVVLTCIVFLNFIIAEVSASYEKVKERLDSLFLSERAKLIQEAQDMLLKTMKTNDKWFPKYLVTRELEE